MWTTPVAGHLNAYGGVGTPYTLFGYLSSDYTGSTDTTGTVAECYNRNNVTDLALSLSANSTYLIRGIISVTRNATGTGTGFRFTRDVAISSAYGTCWRRYQIAGGDPPVGSTARWVHVDTSKFCLPTYNFADTTMKNTAAGTTTVAGPFMLHFVLATSGAVTIGVQIDSTATPTILKAGSHLRAYLL